MKIFYLFFCVFYISFLNGALSQVQKDSNEKKILDHTVYDKWKRIERQKISNDGDWVSYEINEMRGNGFLYFFNNNKKLLDSIPRGFDSYFSSKSEFAAFRVRAPFDSVRVLKIKKKKPEEILKDTLAILYLSNPDFYSINLKDNFIDTLFSRLDMIENDIFDNWNFSNTKTGFLIKIPKVKKYQVTENNSDWIAFTTEPNAFKKKSSNVIENIKDCYDLTILNPKTLQIYRFKNVTEFTISKSGNFICFSSLSVDPEVMNKRKKKDEKKADIQNVSNIYFLPLNNKKEQAYKIFSKKGIVKKVTLSESGERVAFIFSSDTSAVKRWELNAFNYKTVNTSDDVESEREYNDFEILPKINSNYTSNKIADTNSTGLYYNWEISENGNLIFSEDGNKLFFGTAPKVYAPAKDTLPDDEKAKLDVWNWNDGLLQTQQLHDLDVERKRTYFAVYHFSDKKIIQVADTIIQDIYFANKGNSDIAIGYSMKPYEKIISYIDPAFYDFYMIDMLTGTKTKFLTKKQYFISFSEKGNFVIYYEPEDSSYYSYRIKDGVTFPLSKNSGIRVSDEENDRPKPPEPYGIAGWSKGEEYIFIYDRFDIWKVSPENKINPIRLTNGRENEIIYRYIKLNPEEKFLPDTLLIKGVKQTNFSESFNRFYLSENRFENLTNIEASYLQPIKAKKSNIMLWQKMTYSEFPELLLGNYNFQNEIKISNTNPQQTKYNWGKVELVDWTMPDSTKQRGLLYLPENFDVNKKYPMIVYFYEKYTDKFYTHYIPSPSRSVINFPLYNSNGYIIFIPDINYKIGHPGRSAYDAIMSGTISLCKERSYIDANRIGLQGQSWGGYQVAYMVTQTDFFVAAMAGAPVANMTSAYGGIRWESGMTRAFQYETDQSRIGKTLWDGFDLYIENSPLFFADKVKTPLLMMANDNDGAVPWQQGIEFFVSLRRLEKPCWLLCYNGDEHNLLKWPNRVDLSIRMQQFFDTYLKGAEMPLWMKEGIPAIKKVK